MFRKIIILIVLLSLTVSFFSISVSAFTASEEQSIRAAIQNQFDAFARDLNYPDVHEDAISQLLNHALAGRGATLNAKGTDPIACSMLNTAMFREAFVDTMMEGLQIMRNACNDRILTGGAVTWHEHNCAFYAHLYEYNDTVSQADDVRVGYDIISGRQPKAPINSNDKTMMLIVGWANYRMRINRIRSTAQECVYRVQLTVEETFSFDGDYTSHKEKYDTTVSDLINLVGKMMDIGLIDTYLWNFNTSLEITVPNYCDHSSYDYGWERQGTDLVSTAGDGFSANPLTRIEEKMQNGDTLPRYYYRLQDTVRLMHDRPWVVEFALDHWWTNAALVSDKSTRHTNSPFLLKSMEYVSCSYYNLRMAEGDDNFGKSVQEQYGVSTDDPRFQTDSSRVFRLENRVNTDGTNMIWVLIDGIEVGPLNEYMPFINKDSQFLMTGQTNNWVCGKDISINYIGAKEIPLRYEGDLQYLYIWEDGVPGENPNYLTSSVTAPTCTEQGCTDHICKLCGAQFRDSYVPPLGHSYVAAQTVAATCTAGGYTVYSCSVCGDSYNADFVDATGHHWDGGVITKTAIFAQPGEKLFTCYSCKETRQEAYEKPLLDLAGTTMTLGDSLDVSFVVDTSVLEDFGTYAVVTKTYADGRESVSLTIPQIMWRQYDKALYYFSFDGVAAKEMCDSLSVQIFNAQGMPISNLYTDSIRDYAMRMLSKADVLADEALRTLYVDMLNYGAEAQLQFGYDTENLANRYLTEAQQAYASGTCPTKDMLAAGPGRAGTTLTLKSRITLDFLFSSSVMDHFSYAVAAYTDHYGKPVEIRITDLQSYDDARICISVPGLAVADYAQMVTCTVYNAAGDAVAWATDSIEGYIHRMAGKLPAMVEAIAKFGASGYRYFHAA